MENREKTIIAMGSGGFTHEPENPLLDLYVLSQSPSDNPAISFLPTAHSDPANYIANFHKSFACFRCRPSCLDLFHPHTSDMEDYLLSQDIIYVGGGNTRSMLAVWREWGIDTILKKAWTQGVVLAGVSAGAMCWFEEGVTASVPDRITHINALGFLTGACCPHYDTSPERRAVVHERLQSGAVQKAYLIDDHAALHFADDKVKYALASLPGKKASITNGHETLRLPINYLSDIVANTIGNTGRFFNLG